VGGGAVGLLPPRPLVGEHLEHEAAQLAAQYYEVGIRHAAKETGCVLLAADWSRQLFDAAQMRTVRYPLAEGDITEPTAQAFHDATKDAIQKLAAGASPMHESIKGFPFDVDERAASSMKDQMAELAAFQGAVRAVRAAPRSERMGRARGLVAIHGKPPMTVPVAIALLRLLRDSAEDANDWNAVLDFVSTLPNELAKQAEVREQLAFALSSTGKQIESIDELEAIVEISGPTPERLGLLGGRYKRLLKSSATPEERRLHLNKSIEYYEQGMDLDLNDYYCSCNLPRLYRQRNRRGDEERAQTVLKIVIAACERAKRRGITDEWLRPTLLGAAFDAGDADKAEELAEEVALEGATRWKLTSVLNDLEASVIHVSDDERRERLTTVIAALKSA
jgi:MAP3K TRAFs-binding domain